MSLKIYRQDLKVTGEGLVTFNFEVENLKVEEVIMMIACLKNPELLYGTSVSTLFSLKILTLQFKVT